MGSPRRGGASAMLDEGTFEEGSQGGEKRSPTCLWGDQLCIIEGRASAKAFAGRGCPGHTEEGGGTGPERWDKRWSRR